MGCDACKIGADNQDQLLSTSEVTSHRYGTQPGIVAPASRAIWLQNLLQPAQAENVCFAQIKKDIARTFPSTHYFADRGNMDRFENLLRKFALYFPKVGYTQGLNFLAGYLLIAGFDDEEAFQMLVKLALNDKLLMIGLYEDLFPLNKLYCAVFWKLLEKRHPNTAAKIRLAGILDEIWIFQWFMTFFLYSFPVEFVERLIGYIICKKQLAMVSLALGIVDCIKNDIADMRNPDEFDMFEYFDKLKSLQFCQERIDLDKVINYANSITKYQISKALEEIKLPKNIYYTYFRRENERGQIYREITQKLNCQRRMFQADPNSSAYIRDLNEVEHLERMLLNKSKLYMSRTDSRYSSQIRTSNYTVDLGNQVVSESRVSLNQKGGYMLDKLNRFYGSGYQQPFDQFSQQANYGIKNKEAALMRAQTHDESSASRDSRLHLSRNL